MQKNRLIAIVEGPGDENAVPALIRRILHEYLNTHPIAYQLTKIKARQAGGKGNITVAQKAGKRNSLENYLEEARGFVDCLGVIVLIDADKEDIDCPVNLATSLAKRAEKLGLPFPVSVVVAVCEYESWFLHNLDTIAQKYLADETIRYDGDAEAECSAKGWLIRNMASGQTYKEEFQQPKMTYDIDIPHTINASRSFRRMVNAVKQLLDAIENGATIVTPITPQT